MGISSSPIRSRSPHDNPDACPLPRTTEARCPTCKTVTRHRHGRYRRRLDDMALTGRRMTINLSVQRFRCLATTCPQGTRPPRFVERTRRRGQVEFRVRLRRGCRHAARCPPGGRASDENRSLRGAVMRNPPYRACSRMRTRSASPVVRRLWRVSSLVSSRVGERWVVLVSVCGGGRR
ncbi:transposase family protein [Acrocarpospora catenulata]|uniref:transposase family protein n=1 Tax=Acrocarpospora catenulata TaxID=2836182 RepID=UPI0027DFCDEF|nr:transposase family protein [Acrocarpospora catenulata]